MDIGSQSQQSSQSESKSQQSSQSESNIRIFKVLYSFEAEGDEEMSISKGDFLFGMLEDYNSVDDWALGRRQILNNIQKKTRKTTRTAS